MDAFLGELQLYGFNYPPRNFAFASGQLLPIQQNTALFALIGTYYGGNGTTIFQMPNLVAATPCGQGQGPGLSDRVTGETFGETSVNLIQNQMPAHTHTATGYVQRGTTNKVGTPTTGALLGVPTGSLPIVPAGTPNTMLNPQMIGVAGGSQPHPNQQPYLGLNWCICTSGVFPSFN